jgi:hypothetical protein
MRQQHQVSQWAWHQEHDMKSYKNFKLVESTVKPGRNYVQVNDKIADALEQSIEQSKKNIASIKQKLANLRIQ